MVRCYKFTFAVCRKCDSKFLCYCCCFSTRPSKTRRAIRKKNPLKNIGIMMKLNPHAKTVKRAEMLTVERRRAAKEAVLSKKREGK